MKKTLFRAFSLVLVVVLTLTLASCGNKGWKPLADDAKTITVAASPTPHALILQQCVSLMQAKGYTLVIKEFSDYVIPNTATESGEVDANYFQHTPYLTDFNQENGTHLVSVAGIHYEPFGIYAGKVSSLDVKTGLTIAIPNDGTNEARALLLLEQEGFITLNPGVGMSATKLDIADAKGNTITELEAAAVSSARQDCDLVILNGNYAIAANLKVSDALAIESATSTAADTYVNILVVRDGNQDKAIVKALVECLQSQTVKDYINATFEGSVVPKF